MSEKSLVIEPVSERYTNDVVNLYERVYGGEYPLIREPNTIRDMIKSGRYIWHLAFTGDGDEKRLVGSMAGEKDDWNSSFEIGKGVVDKEHRNIHVGYGLFESITNQGIRETEVQWGYARNAALLGMVNLYENANNTFFYKVGYVPGKFRVRNRENHAIKLRVNEEFKGKRIEASLGIQDHSPFIKKILLPFDFPEKPGNYPERIVVGPKRGDVITVNSGEVLYEELPDNTFVVNAVDGDEIRAIRDFVGLMSCSEYLEVVLHADKVDEIKSLKGMGLDVCCYLPAWSQLDEKRYDCLKMARHTESVSADDTISYIVKEFDDGFSGLLDEEVSLFI